MGMGFHVALPAAVQAPVLIHRQVLMSHPFARLPLALQKAPPVSSTPSEVSHSEFVRLLRSRKIDSISLDDSPKVRFEMSDGVSRTAIVSKSEHILRLIDDSNASVDFAPAAKGSLFQTVALTAGVYVAMFLAARKLMSMKGVGEDIFGFGRGTHSITLDNDTTFMDVAGAEHAKEEISELVDFLKAPEKFHAAGARIPRGCIIYGNPGVGKTLLARAVAGEAGVPFLSCSGSEFVEMFVGVGASRVRDIFSQARDLSPCIVFIDEIDAIGRQRGSGQNNEEREQTLNQLLTEMDGFDELSDVIVLAATNRIDILDNALLRPGRFDRKVEVLLPSYEERHAILKVHSEGKDVRANLKELAENTTGFSGADLANLMNEAAILAARSNSVCIEDEQAGQALERIMIGLKRSIVLTYDQKRLLAYHEAGHALLACYFKADWDSVSRISIIPRGGAGGVTVFKSDKRFMDGIVTRAYLESGICVMLGGRAAEEIIFGKKNVTTGSVSDIQNATKIAKDMVERFGLTDNYMMDCSQLRGGVRNAELVIGSMIADSYKTALRVLNDNLPLLNTVALALMKNDTLSEAEFNKFADAIPWTNESNERT